MYEEQLMIDNGSDKLYNLKNGHSSAKKQSKQKSGLEKRSYMLTFGRLCTVQ